MSKEKKNRFYYSFSQECISQKMGEIDDMFNKIEGVRENYVLTPNGWEKYTEWCSQKGSKCNWGDAKLIFETNDSPEIKIEYRKTTQLAAKELELILVKNQLKEKEEELEKNDDEWREICDGKLETINRLIEEKHELEETIKNKSHNKWLKAEAERYKNEYQSLKGYIDQLKQQLAEKNAEVKSWKDGTMVVKLGKLEEQLAEKEKKLELRKSFCRACQSIDNKTAIAELEKVKVKLNEEINNASVLLDPVEYEDYHELLGVIRGYKLSVDQIDQQIKSLKGE